jgi:putative ABC transport system ATP-binding protein
MVGLANRKTHIPGKMSGGEQQRVAIARALAIEPTFLLADEPTGNLDTSNSKRVMSLLRKLVEDHQQTIVMVTHDPAVSAQADRVIHLLDGQVEREEFLSERRSVTAQLAEARPR